MILQKLKDTKKSFNNSKKKLDAYNVDTVPIHTSKEREYICTRVHQCVKILKLQVM